LLAIKFNKNLVRGSLGRN